MVPTAKPIADFHSQAIAHAGRTQQKRPLVTPEAFIKPARLCSKDIIIIKAVFPEKPERKHI